MGYTHYFRSQGISESAWKKIVEKTKQIFQDGRVRDFLCEEFNKPSFPPIANGQMIRFNGKNEEGHETFVVTPEAFGFNFCKTAQKDYDAAVVAVLIAVKAHSPATIQISSDGNVECWLAGLEIYNSVADTVVNKSQLAEWLEETDR